MYGECDVEGWTEIIFIACGNEHTAGLRKDGTVVVTEGIEDGEYDVEDWTGITSIACGDCHIVGLKVIVQQGLLKKFKDVLYIKLSKIFL